MRVLLAVLAGAALVAGVVEDASACSCVPPDAPAYLERFDGAFVGRLVEKREQEPRAPWGGSSAATYVFEVERVYKGRLPRELHVVAPLDGASCGIEVPVGARTGLFLEQRDGEWQSSLCLQVGAAELESAAADAGIDDRQPLAGSTAGGSGGPGAETLLAAGAAALLVLVLAAVLLVRRRRGRSQPLAA